MSAYDTLIQGGTLVDGRRNPRVRADVAIKDGRIAAIGLLKASDAERVLDAGGMIVAPGFVDLHTHYDSQLFWDPYCTISGLHGITSVAIGNCGYGFAPVRPGERAAAMRTLTRVEQISYESMRLTLPWTWESFPEFLDAIEATPKGVNVLPYMGVNPLLSYVMGEEAAKSRPATEQENARIAGLFSDALAAGACGWSAVRCAPDCYSSVHRDHDGTPFASDLMSKQTALALARVMARRNEGFAQQTLVSDDPLDDMAHLEELAEVSGRPVIWNVLVGDAAEPGRHRMAIAWFDSCRERGLPLYCQAITCDTSAAFTLDFWNLWDANPAWRRALTGDAAERMRKLSDPAVRAGLRHEDIVLYPLRLTTLIRTELAEYKKYEGMTVTRIAAELDVHPVDALLDICVAEGLRTHWKAPVLEPADSVIRELIQSPWVIPGVSDGGAHSKMMTTGRYPTEHIETYVREYGWVTLEEMHWKLSAFPAWVAGFRNRGSITNGAPADIVVYDYDALRALPDEIVHDLPGGDWRRYCRAEGYRYIIVNGGITFTDGKCTGVTPGRLLRHGG